MDLLTLIPSEVLPTIFGFLSLEDRKNVRLTCQSFRDACDRADIVKREKFTFHFGHMRDYTVTADFAKYLKRCKRIRSEVEFRMVDLTRLPLGLWKNLGNRITCLLLDHCCVNAKVLKRIFLHCSELVNLHMNLPDLVVKEFGVSLGRLIALKIKRSNLRTFKVFAREPLRRSTVYKIFETYPNVNTFGWSQYRSRNYSMMFDPLYRTTIIGTRFKLPPSVENFIYLMNASTAWMVPDIRYPIPKFKELELRLVITRDEDLEIVKNFFSVQTELKKIFLEITFPGFVEGGPSHFPPTIMFHIFRTLPELKALRVHSSVPMEFYEWREFAAALPKNLESLDLCPLDTIHENFSRFELPSMDYCKLTHLRLDHWFRSPLQLEILKRCRSLQCLKFEHAHKETLDCILRNHTELRRLSLKYADYSSIIPMDEHFFSVRLQRLEYLEVSGLYYDNDAVDSAPPIVSFLSKLDCPKLKVFQCYGTIKNINIPFGTPISEEDTIEVLKTLSQRIPLLETLALSSKLPIHEYHSHCKNLKKLRNLVLTDYANLWAKVQPNALKQLFDVCPSLTFLVLELGDGDRTFFYDRTTRSLITHCHDGFGSIGEILNIISYQ